MQTMPCLYLDMLKGPQKLPCSGKLLLSGGHLMPAPHLESQTREALVRILRIVTTSSRAAGHPSVLSRPPQHQPQSWLRSRGPPLAPCCCHSLRKPCPAQAGPTALTFTGLTVQSVGRLPCMGPACNPEPNMPYFIGRVLATQGRVTLTLAAV